MTPICYRPADKKVKDVIVTGTFDNWSKTLPLVKRPDGSFELEVPLAKGTEKIEFKFVLNGDEWVTSDTYWTVVDETGNTNNYIEFAKDGSVLKAEKNVGKTEFGKTENGKTTYPTIIPESGLSMGSAAPAAAGAAVLAHGKKEQGDVKSTVMPNQEGVQTTLGEPGVFVPENPQEISAFKEVRDVDAKKLNADIKEQEQEQEKEAAAAAAPGSAASAGSEGKAKYVKKVKKLVSPEEAKKAETDAKADAKADTKEMPANTGTASSTATKDTAKKTAKKEAAPSSATSSSAKKEKRGFFSRVKKALS